MPDYSSYYSSLKSFSSSGGKITYYDKGQGDTILLLHGVPTSSWLYRNISEDLVTKGYRVIAPDMLGFGGSEKPEGYEIYSAANHAKRLLELMVFLEIPNWTHVFHNGGGLWTWELVLKDKSKITRLVMLNSIVYQAGFKPPIKFKKGLIGYWYSKWYCSRLGQFIVLNATFKNGVHNKKVINKNILEGYKKPLLENGYRAMYYFFTQTCRSLKDYSGLHKSLHIPFSVIWGKYDNMLVWENIKEEVKKNFNLKNEDIHVLEAKHFIQEELPSVVAEKIARFAG